jgi:Arc/MetJ-type ribon-helix-helix transcriptional regulator
MTQVAIQIPDDLKPFIERSVKSGLFSDAADFVVNLLYNVKAESESELSEQDLAKLAVLKTEIAIGVDQIKRGEIAEFDAEDIIARGRARLAAKQTAAHA